MRIGVNSFVYRQTDPEFGGTIVTMEQLSSIRDMLEKTPEAEWKAGYAPFCKLVYVSFPSILCPVVEITKENEHLLRSGYVTRREGELPYLSRWFPKIIKGSQSHRVLVVLYAREHLVETGEEHTGAAWDIISINAELDQEVPMTPDTMLRNHMGKEFGGSGYSIDRGAYQRSVDFWSRYALIGGK